MRKTDKYFIVVEDRTGGDLTTIMYMFPDRKQYMKHYSLFNEDSYSNIIKCYEEVDFIEKGY